VWACVRALEPCATTPAAQRCKCQQVIASVLTPLRNQSGLPTLSDHVSVQLQAYQPLVILLLSVSLSISPTLPLSHSPTLPLSHSPTLPLSHFLLFESAPRASLPLASGFHLSLVGWWVGTVRVCCVGRDRSSLLRDNDRGR
jgi:hypothetical protein